MELRVLAILKDDDDAARLVATWPVVGPDADVVIDGRDVKMSETDLDFWGQVSGVDPEDIERRLPRLFLTGVLEPGGATDQHASTYLTNAIKASLPKASR